jgi:hypothetical protein
MASNTAKKTAASSGATDEKKEQPSGGSDEALQVDGNAGTQDFSAGDNGAIVISATDQIDTGLFTDAGEVDKLVTVDKDVYEEFYFPGTKRPSHRLLYTAGQTVKQSDLDRINASRKAAAEADPAAFPVDPTTLASGTRAEGPVVSSAETA